MIRRKFFLSEKINPCVVTFKNKTIMLAWLKQYCLIKTIIYGFTVFWSRSREEIWLKGKTSLNYQILKRVYIDCDKDTVLFDVYQINNKCCHFSKKKCFHEFYKRST
ncbi:phosphoribosyl-AMP cyclohydrolase [Candidatus Vidania fulgoroideorum]